MEIKPATKFTTVDKYLSVFPASTKILLQKLRQAIKETAPQAEEVISYNMPGFKFHGTLVWYAGYKEHIGFYPTPSAIEVFKTELTNYKTSKGAIQIPLDKGIPSSLVKKIVKFRISENLKKIQAKQKKKK